MFLCCYMIITTATFIYLCTNREKIIKKWITLFQSSNNIFFLPLCFPNHFLLSIFCIPSSSRNSTSLFFISHHCIIVSSSHHIISSHHRHIISSHHHHIIVISYHHITSSSYHIITSSSHHHHIITSSHHHITSHHHTTGAVWCCRSAVCVRVLFGECVDEMDTTMHTANAHRVCADCCAFHAFVGMECEICDSFENVILQQNVLCLILSFWVQHTHYIWISCTFHLILWKQML